MDREGKYLLPFVGMCETSKKIVEDYIIKNPTGKTSCRSLDDLKKIPHLLVYKHKGIDLHKYLTTTETLMPLKEMVPHLLNVAEGIQLLQKDGNRFAHSDIKPDNVLLADLENGEKRMLLMDFGLLENLNRIYNNNGKLNHNSPHYPPELLVFYVLNEERERPKADTLYNLMFSKATDEISDPEKGVAYRARNKTWADSIEKYEDKLKQFFTKLYKFVDKVEHDKESKNLREYFTKNFAKKMDVFQFGYVLHKVANMYEAQPGDVVRFNDLRAIVENTYHPNPYDRWDIETVIVELKKMVNKSYSTSGVPKVLEKKEESGVIARHVKKGEIFFMNNKSLKMLQRYIITNKKKQAQTAGNKGAKTVGSKKVATTTKRPTASARSGTTKKK